MNKIIIDTDPGHDDAMALLMLLASDKVEILAIVTVAGNSTIENTTRNAKYILSLVRERRESGNIPIFSGAEKPLVRDLVVAKVHGASGLEGSGAELLEAQKTQETACDKIIEIVKQNPGEITLLTLGPLTNIAKAFQKEPSLPNMIKRMVIMGGAVSVCGNKSRTAEFNFFVDPEAAKMVFEASIEKVLIPLDACNEIILPKESIEDIKEKAGDIGETLANMLLPYVDNLKKFDNMNGALMYDPLAAYYLINPDAFKLEDMDIVIETKGEHTFGMSVAEKRSGAKKSPDAKVAVEINGEEFISDFVDSIIKLG